MSCGSTYLYLKKTITDTHVFAFVPARCKSWSCPTCRPIKAKIVRDYILQNFTEEPLYMVTLTFFHSGSVLSCWRDLGKKWNKMRTYIAKKYGAFDYIRMVEPHKQGGWPHMHILIRGHNMHVDIVDKITKWGFGWNFHSKQMPVKSAARYVCKYLTKEWPDTEGNILRQASKCRIVSVSRGMPAVFQVTSDWDVVEYDIPDDRTKFVCNAIINKLRERGASYVLSRPFGGGFIIQSDVNVCSSVELNMFDGAVWQYSDGLDYAWLPHGIQEQLDFSCIKKISYP